MKQTIALQTPGRSELDQSSLFSYDQLTAARPTAPVIHRDARFLLVRSGSGILRLHDPAFLARMPKDLPLLFLAGDADPVGEQGKGVRRAIQSLKDAGVQNIQCKLYPGARHELLVETNKQEVFADIGNWLDTQLS